MGSALELIADWLLARFPIEALAAQLDISPERLEAWLERLCPSPLVTTIDWGDDGTAACALDSERELLKAVIAERNDPNVRVDWAGSAADSGITLAQPAPLPAISAQRGPRVHSSDRGERPKAVSNTRNCILGSYDMIKLASPTHDNNALPIIRNDCIRDQETRSPQEDPGGKPADCAMHHCQAHAKEGTALDSAAAGALQILDDEVREFNGNSSCSRGGNGYATPAIGIDTSPIDARNADLETGTKVTSPPRAKLGMRNFSFEIKEITLVCAALGVRPIRVTWPKKHMPCHRAAPFGGRVPVGILSSAFKAPRLSVGGKGSREASCGTYGQGNTVR